MSVTKQPQKQRKRVFSAATHRIKSLFSANLAKELRKKYGLRNFPLRKGDRVKIMRGQFKKRSGKIVDVQRKNRTVHIENIQVAKRDGTKAFYPFHPSNVQVMELNLDDKRRKKKVEMKVKEKK